MIVLDRDWLAECSKRIICEKMMEKRNRPTEVEDRVHVLVAEDDEALRRLMVSVLESESYSVCSASGGREAMEIICKGGIDVALLDVKMPDISGMEVLRVAKRTDPEMEVIVITGYADTDTAVEAVRYRAYDFIRKPFDDIRQLPTFVRRAAEKRKMARENARLTGEVQRRNRLLQEQLAELTLLYELSNGIAHVLDYERLSEHLLDTFLSLTKVEACSSLLVRQAKPILIVKAKRRMTPNALDNAKELALEAAREVAGCDLTAEATRLRYDGVHNTGEERDRNGVSRISGEKSEAVIVDGELVGILSMFLLEKEKFNPADVRLFSLLATQASQAVAGVRQALQTEKSRMSAMIESMAEGIVMLGNEGEVTVLNPAAKRMLGLSGNGRGSSPNLGQRLQELGLWDSSGTSIKDKRWEGRLPSPDSQRIVQAQVSEVTTPEGEWIGDVLVLRDVTKEKESERLKAEFVSTVSHELRTPLTGIKYIISNLIKGIADEISPKQRLYLEMAEESTERLRRLIDDLLCLSRIETEKLSLQRSVTNVRHVAERVLTTFMPAARAHSVALEACFPSAEVRIDADAMRLEQVLNNLVENAIKFTPAEGRVAIEVNDRGQEIEVAVSDTGRGVPAEDREKVFERFHQMGREEGARAKGTGLGLTIAKELVEMHGGQIWVETAEGEGSRFLFTLPKEPVEDRRKEKIPLKGCEQAEEKGAKAKDSGRRR